MFLHDSSLELFSHIAGTVTIMGKLTSVSGVSLLKTKKQQKYKLHLELFSNLLVKCAQTVSDPTNVLKWFEMQ